MTVTVHGSINVDLVYSVARLPSAGETIIALDTARTPGGKGANQAIAAAFANASVEMSGMVGDDDDGRFMIACLGAAGVGVTSVRSHPSAATGTALIAVEPGGQNLIIVSSGANAWLEEPATPAPGLLLAQAETPLASLADAMRAAAGPIVFNAAPVVAGIEALLLLCDVIVVNETELAALSHAGDGEKARARELLCRSSQAIIVTLGAAGAIVVTADAVTHLPGHVVDAVDTTGAGDCFCGVLAAGLDRGLPIEEAARRANAAAALSTTRHGAGTSMPRALEVTAFLASLTSSPGANRDAA